MLRTRMGDDCESVTVAALDQIYCSIAQEMTRFIESCSTEMQGLQHKEQLCMSNTDVCTSKGWHWFAVAMHLENNCCHNDPQQFVPDATNIFEGHNEAWMCFAHLCSNTRHGINTALLNYIVSS